MDPWFEIESLDAVAAVVVARLAPVAGLDQLAELFFKYFI